MNKSDPNDLDGVLERLRAHHPPPSEVDLETRALVDQPEVKHAIEERRRLEEMPDPEAPAPVEIKGDSGALLVQAKAAATYVAPVEVELREAPRMPSGPVRLQAEIDPRRRETVRIKHKEASAPEERGGVYEIAGAEDAHAGASGIGSGIANEDAAYDPPVRGAKPADRTSKRGTRTRGVLVGGAIVFVAGVIVAMAALKRPEPPNEAAASATPTQSVPPPIAKTAAAVEAASAPSVASAPGVTATAAEAAATGSAPAASASGRPAPKTTATVEPSAAPAVTSAPSAAPAPTVAPSAAPSVPSVVPGAQPGSAPTATPVIVPAAPAPSPSPLAPSTAPRSDTIIKPAGGTKLED